MLNTLLPILLFAALGLAVLGALRRAAMWRRGRASKVDLVGGLLAMPRRYMVDLHHVVARDKYIANTHVATAGGAVASIVLALLVHGFGLHNRVLAYALLLMSALMFVGAIFVYRRRRNPPSRLSKGPWMRLPKSLLAFSASFFLVTLPVAGILPEQFGGWLLAAILALGVLWGVSELFLGMTWGGPMKHAFAGALHLAWHRRAERFGGGRSTGLKPLDLEDPSAPLGVEKPVDFTWNQLLGFDACVQCGKCEAACPAFAAGQPLNPKKLIQDMVVGLAGGSDAHFAGSPYPSLDGRGQPLGEHHGGPHLPIVALQGKALVDAETLWSCTTCRACVEECPMMIEHVDAIVDMRRHLTLEKGATPNKGAEVLENLIATDNPGGFNPGGRMNWAADLNLKLLPEVKSTEVLFWVGDGAFDMRNQRTLRAFVKVLKAAGVDFAVLGLEERDSGDVARRLGDEATFQQLARRNIQTLAKYQFQRIVTCDPHSFHVLKNEYGALGGDYQVQHHSTYIAELIAAGQLDLGRHKGGSVTYHDPCYLGRYNGEYEAPRQVLRALGIEVKEMQRAGFRSRCCGGGGGAPITDIPGKQRIPDMRMEDIRETGAELVAVGCPQCTAMLEGVVEPRPMIKDIAELVAEALLESAAPSKAPVVKAEPAEVH
ncbi:MAG: dimethylglycine demethylation protein DgcB [Pseudomonas piscis]|uniref:Dimethylglycine demethylation protein DgcB n=2 Tax=Pseudomonas chlororaphis group TaxID=136842 RepID=A0ABY9NG27_9PSED|nr:MULTISPECIES: dimethylglycine demethylation protein DgcB [Pseudomonas chlororaphis group]AZC25590.1 DgcB Dimethylglycine demethylase subunit B [Pseudomonas sessilinigenes]QXH40357.1 dimethylglycine demethylation protein DgcB [Pseudomonas sessilinigenes]WMN17346.1 dimethylglycine demethylation protein DgcB [Pseudomonas piscis]